MTEMLRTPSKTASLRVRQGEELPEGEATDVALEKETATPLRILLDAEHGRVVVLSDDNGASRRVLFRELLVATDVLAVAAAGVQEESACEGADEGVNGLEELGGGGGEVGAEVAVGAVDEGRLDVLALVGVVEDACHAEGRIAAAGRGDERGNEDERALLSGLAGRVEEGTIARVTGEEECAAFCGGVAEMSLGVVDVETRRGVCEHEHEETLAEGVVVQMERERVGAGEGTHQDTGVRKRFVQRFQNGVEVGEHEGRHGFPSESLGMRDTLRGLCERSHLVVTGGAYRHPRVPFPQESVPSETAVGERRFASGQDRNGRRRLVISSPSHFVPSVSSFMSSSSSCFRGEAS